MEAKQIVADFSAAAEAMVIAARLKLAADRLEPMMKGLEGCLTPHRSPQKIKKWVRTLRRDEESLQEVPRNLCRDGFGGLTQSLRCQKTFPNGARVCLASYRHLPGLGELEWAVLKPSGHLSFHAVYSPGRGGEERLLEFLEQVEALTPEEVRRLFGGS